MKIGVEISCRKLDIPNGKEAPSPRNAEALHVIGWADGWILSAANYHGVVGVMPFSHHYTTPEQPSIVPITRIP